MYVTSTATELAGTNEGWLTAIAKWYSCAIEAYRLIKQKWPETHCIYRDSGEKSLTKALKANKQKPNPA